MLKEKEINEYDKPSVLTFMPKRKEVPKGTPKK
jgi:hypothetical protein